jgi:hypothetical protein
MRVPFRTPTSLILSQPGLPIFGVGIALAYLKEGGLLLSIGLLAGVVVLAVGLAGSLGDRPRREMDLRPPVLARHAVSATVNLLWAPLGASINID